MANKKSKASTPAAGADAKKKRLTIPAESFKTSEGKEYKFTAAHFMLDGQTITAEEALNDDKVLAKLVSMGAGVIEEVEVEEEGGE